VARGILSLMPADGRRGPAVTAAIEDGRYALDESTGPCPGPHKLVVLLETDKKARLLRKASPRATESPPQAGRFEFRIEVPDRGRFEHNVSLDQRGGT